ncbi:hypothetical protein TRVL_08742 [Trypanosoma vivax]|nr:hypothetical protein TRVL_08742 [Trypanosoma vivax]
MPSRPLRQQCYYLLVFSVFMTTVVTLTQNNSMYTKMSFKATTVKRNPLYKATQTLIIVPGHGVLNTLNASEWRKQERWCMEPHQLRDGVIMPLCFASHIRRALEVLKENIESSILIFSGGQTCRWSGPRSEGLSYYLVAEETNLFGLFGSAASVKRVLLERIFAEEFARDSYENLLFSIARFYEIIGGFPEKIVVVGWKHKERRFTMYHRKAIRFPAGKFEYIGLDFDAASDFVDDSSPYRKAKPYKDSVALSYVTKDMYLCEGEWKARKQRNPNFRFAPYEISCPPLRPLLRYCGQTIIGKDQVPWG